MLATEYYCKTLGKRNQTIVKFSVVNPEPVGSGTYFTWIRIRNNFFSDPDPAKMKELENVYNFYL